MFSGVRGLLWGLPVCCFLSGLSPCVHGFQCLCCYLNLFDSFDFFLSEKTILTVSYSAFLLYASQWDEQLRSKR